ncbi:3-isopropylmalate dehydratase large subunit [hydrothermal vent metagenome]|uniref:3-isopropylmalate dehydratase large subunit n=1 Tax=hydrothermal vent metagenome TaxID=652676 RepID=A0A3B1BAC1_9ZZZZ
MAMTITEKILAVHAGVESVQPGEIVTCNVDIALGNDITAPIAINAFEKAGATEVFDKKRVVLVPDHFAPNKDIASAGQCKRMREFAKDKEIENYFEVGKMGIEHALLPEEGLTLPGHVIIGADSHTCTYGALGAFSTGIGSTDLAATMITGKIWFKTPESMKFIFHGEKKNRWISGKDLILYTIGKIGVSGALYRAMEFTGQMIEDASMDDRFALANMAVEAGAKNGIMQADKKTTDFIKSQAKQPQREWVIYESDEDAQYHSIYEFDGDDIDLQVAYPHLPENTRPVGEAKDVRLDQVIIGSCTNGRFVDLEVAAGLLKGNKVADGVRMIIIPATQRIYKKAMNAGLFDIFIDAGAAVSTPTCGPCLGGHMGILAEGEKCLATTNRNFVGRMGHPKSEVYLASPAVAAASAVTGVITDPADVGGK